VIGGGMAPEKAMTAVKHHVDMNERGLLPSVLVAYAVLEAVMIGVLDDPVRKETPVGGQANRLYHDDGRLRRSEIIAIGAGLGWPPSVTYQQTLWEIIAAIDGHNRVQGGEDKLEPPSDAQFEAMLDEHLLHEVGRE
jgi:hypothetical protein